MATFSRLLFHEIRWIIKRDIRIFVSQNRRAKYDAVNK
jgi:hypothetical protein